MKSAATSWRVIVAVIGLACLTAPAISLAVDDNDEREHHRQMQPARPDWDGHAPEMRCGPGMSWHGCRFLKYVAIILAVIHVMLAMWVFTDIRKRGEGHGIFVVLALLAGIPATILYALVRLGDMKKG